MALSYEAAARVMVVGKDPIVTHALARLLDLDAAIKVLPEAPTIGTAPIARLNPDVVILDEAGQIVETAVARAYLEKVAPASKLCLLDELRGLTIHDALQIIKRIAPPRLSHDEHARHLQLVPGSVEHAALANLSERELEVVRLVAEGLSNKEISSRLSLSDKTVKNHISHVLSKMNLTARTQVAVYALRAGVV